MRLVAEVVLTAIVLGAVFWPLERLFSARAGQPFLRPKWQLDLAYFFGQYLVWGAAAIWLLTRVQALLPTLPKPALPGWLLALVVLVLGDVCVYWFHRACHRFDFLWRFHAVHHSSEHLDWLAAHREHPLDGLCTQLAQNLPAILLGAPLELLAGVAAFRGMWGLYIHSNARLPVGPLGLLLGEPELHHWHHLKHARVTHNYANLAPYLDKVFGTFHRPGGAENWELGLPTPFPKSYFGQLVAPFIPSPVEGGTPGRHGAQGDEGFAPRPRSV